MDPELVGKLVAYCKEKLDFTIPAPRGYDSAPICALDSVFSLGIKYVTVERVVDRFLKYLGAGTDTTITTSEVLDVIEPLSAEQLSEIVENHNLTDTGKNPILKTEAYKQFLGVMKEYDIETVEDIADAVNNEDFKDDIMAIRGQTNGTALDYLFILARVDSYVKYDRHIQRFVQNGTHLSNVAKSKGVRLVRETAKALGLTPRHLDFIIWSWQMQQ